MCCISVVASWLVVSCQHKYMNVQVSQKTMTIGINSYGSIGSGPKNLASWAFPIPSCPFFGLEMWVIRQLCQLYLKIVTENTLFWQGIVVSCIWKQVGVIAVSANLNTWWNSAKRYLFTNSTIDYVLLARHHIMASCTAWLLTTLTWQVLHVGLLQFYCKLHVLLWISN